MLASAQSLPNEPRRVSGAGVTAAFEGWFRNPDGSFSLLVDYYNRNQDKPYCQFVIAPKVAKARAKFLEKLKK